MNNKRNNLFMFISTQIFYLAFGLRLAISLITSSLLYDRYYNILKPFLSICNALVLVLLILIILFFQSYRMREIIIISILSIVFQIASSKSGEGFIVLTWFFICASKNIDLKVIAKETAIVSIFILLVLISATGIGFIEMRTLSRANGLLRYSIGYSNPNQLGYIVLQIIVALTLKRNNNFSFSNFFILFMGFLVSYVFLNSRSVAMCICLLGAFIILFRNKCNKQLRYIGVIVAILSPLCSLYISKIYNSQNDWLYYLDKFFSWRIAFANKYIEQYGFSLIGYNLDLTLLGALDNAYVRAAVFYGIIPLSVYIYGVVQLFASEDNSRKIELICIITMMLYGLMESTIFIINCNFTLLIFARVLYKKRVTTSEKLIKAKMILRRI